MNEHLVLCLSNCKVHWDTNKVYMNPEVEKELHLILYCPLYNRLRQELAIHIYTDSSL